MNNVRKSVRAGIGKGHDQVRLWDCSNRVWNIILRNAFGNVFKGKDRAFYPFGQGGVGIAQTGQHLVAQRVVGGGKNGRDAVLGFIRKGELWAVVNLGQDTLPDPINGQRRHRLGHRNGIGDPPRAITGHLGQNFGGLGNVEF